jgi:hypothetical protein
MKLFAIEGVAEIESDDGGLAMIIEIDGGEDEPVFVRLQSWDSTKQHPVLRQLGGKRLRVTVEVVP